MGKQSKKKIASGASVLKNRNQLQRDLKKEFALLKSNIDLHFEETTLKIKTIIDSKTED